ncbi:hypothetical protein A9G00_38280 [Achromobacter xylosoxidans]|uniref:hypothetical protein n=1 Tax=Achromobacter ruhlandii TaxID=72557 RepID=UPI00083A6F9C|nr:hypothetical protein [Achromobacter ruhlandii]OCZ65380.1 hypothetical protein A7P23_17200 [Achromobacter xylosoxidans]ODA17668.1 hypothetical protein A9G00_38280 [Achromobacter xylosoxidans]CAB3718189.1 hypothetical protein LMG1866_03589 [Achromobacter ruhlandii]
MAYNLDVVIETPQHEVDMKTGLDTLQGSSDAIRYISESILTKQVPERLNHKSKVRTLLKQSFKGSYGHVFQLEIHDGDLQSSFNRIGRETFSELIAFYLNEAMNVDSKDLSPKAQKIVEGLGEVSEALTNQLRKSSVKNIHEVPIKFDYDVKLRFRRNRDDQTMLARFDQNTAKFFKAVEGKQKFVLSAMITRLNIHTGNGRLQEEGANHTLPFSFASGYKAVSFKAKKAFSNNLDYNNGLEDKDWVYLNILVRPINLIDGPVIKYLIEGYQE